MSDERESKESGCSTQFTLARPRGRSATLLDMTESPHEDIAHPRWAAALRFGAALVIAAFGAFSLAGFEWGSPLAYLPIAALLVAGAASGRWTALLIPLTLVLLASAVVAGSALAAGALFEENLDDADGRTNAQLALFTLFIGLFGVVPATVGVAAGVLLRRLAAWMLLRRRGSDALAPRGYPVGGLLIATPLLIFVAVGTVIATRPPETVGGDAPASASCSGESPFDVYYLGGDFSGLPLAEAARVCTANGVEMGYGECSYGSCEQQPVEVFSAPLCEGAVREPAYLRLLSDGGDPQDDSYARTSVRGVPAIREEGEGAPVRFEVYTGRTVVTVTGQSRRQVELAGRALRRASGKFVPVEAAGPLYEFADAPRTPVRRLPPPPPGLFEGKVCTEIADQRKRRRERILEERRERKRLREEQR